MRNQWPYTAMVSAAAPAASAAVTFCSQSLGIGSFWILIFEFLASNSLVHLSTNFWKRTSARSMYRITVCPAAACTWAAGAIVGAAAAPGGLTLPGGLTAAAGFGASV